MDNSYFVYTAFDKELHKAIHPKPRLSDSHPDTYHWAEDGIEAAKVISPNMLVKEIYSNRTEHDPKTAKLVYVYLCYNWKLKLEFVLMKSVLEEKYSEYSAQYGRDDNYNTYTRGDYQFLAFSVEAFKKAQPELAGLLEAL